jgi:hypothetical protein
MNIGAKILNKMLANQIQQHTKKIIPYNQIAFILGREECINIYKLINIMHHINRMEEKKIT